MNFVDDGRKKNFFWIWILNEIFMIIICISWCILVKYGAQYSWKKIRRIKNYKINNNKFCQIISLPQCNYKKKLFLGLKLHIYYNITRPFLVSITHWTTTNVEKREKTTLTRSRTTFTRIIIFNYFIFQLTRYMLYLFFLCDV